MSSSSFGMLSLLLSSFSFSILLRICTEEEPSTRERLSAVHASSRNGCFCLIHVDNANQRRYQLLLAYVMAPTPCFCVGQFGDIYSA